jgi:DNA-binding winged helix-turn-helix (wHTH) protein/tetratricopeptide (TPR) repeat protein/TolB-like protein
MSYRFGDFRLEVAERRLLCDGTVVPLTPKVFDTLVLLLENAGHLVPKEELLGKIWPGLVVEEANLTKNMWAIRKALAATSEGPAYIETVPKVGYRWIGPAERVEPATEADPSGHAGQAATPLPPAVQAEGAIRPEPHAPHDAPSHPHGPGGTDASRWPFVGAAAAAALVAGLIILRALPAREGALRTQASRRSVAVVGFRDLAPREGTAWLSTAATEMIGAELGAGEALRVIPADDVSREHVEPPAGTLSAEALARLRRRLGADVVVSGAYLSVAGPPTERLRFDVVVQDTRTGDVLAGDSKTGSAADVLDLMTSLGGGLRARLGLPPTTGPQSESIAAALPRDPEAARLYALGLDHLRRLDARAARDQLARASEREPTNPFIHLALSRAWSALGYDDQARAEARRASENASALSRESRLIVESRLAQVEKHWDRAVEIDRALVLLSPDDPEYGLRLTADQMAAGKARDALESVARLRTLPSPARDDPRIDLAEATAASALSDPARGLAASRRAAEKAAADGRTAILARARIEEAGAAGALGLADRGREFRREAARLYEADGDVNGLALTRIAIGNERSGVGDLDGAVALYSQALGAYETIGNQAGIATAYADLCLVEWLQGKTDAARAHAERVIALRRETNDRQGIAWASNVLGTFLVQEGDFAGAARLHGEALSISREIEDRGYESYSLDAIGDAYRAQGRLDEAEQAYRQSLDVVEKINDRDGIGARDADLGNVELDRGNLAKADTLYQKALELLSRSGDTVAVADTRVQMAQLRRAQGRDLEAIALASGSIGEFEEQHQSGNLAISYATRARAELDLGRLDPARDDIRRARALVADSTQNEAVLDVLLTAARLEAAAGSPDRARALAAQARSRAEHTRWLGYVLEARIVEAMIDLHGPRREDARATLAAVARDARTAGYGGTAREAEEALRARPAA